MLLLASLFPWSLFAPREPIRTLDWAREHAFDHEGKPYDDFAFPHLGAPGGPLDALDCREILEIWLQWATRLGKSFVGQVGALKHADREPCPLMYAGVDRKLAPEVIKKIYGMIEHCPPLADQLPPRTRRSKHLIALRFCQMYVAWARSPSTLADKAVRYGHAGEIDKWEHLSTSKEADPLELFFERFKEFEFAHKKVLESSPALKHSSRVENGRLASHNCRLEVPCPHCGRYQELRMGDGKQPGGITWEHDPAGRSESELARRTATYVCIHCEDSIDDRHRGAMMRAAVWIPEGCGCDDDKARAAAEASRQPGRPLWKGWSDAPWITGTPLRDGPVYGSQLSSLYALSLTWGDVARKYVTVQARPHLLRGFVNGWLGETWSLVKHDEDWETLGDRLMLGPDCQRGTVPAGYRELTAGIDKQADHYVVVLIAWGPKGQAHVVDYAELPDDDALLAWLGRDWPVAGGATRIRVKLALFDSGHKPHGVYELCDRAKKRGLAILPCKGSSTALGAPYVKKRLGPNTTRPGAPHVMVDTITTQDWMEKRLHGEQQRGHTSVFRASLDEHRSFLEQLLNDAPVQRTDKHNQTRESWDRLDASIPNDYRDGFRYGFVAYLLRNKGQEVPPPHTPPAKQAPQAKQRQSRTTPLRRPGGWLNMP